VVADALKRFKTESNEARTFLVEHYTVNPSGIVPIEEAYNAYCKEYSGSARKLVTRQRSAWR
jgi:hypothetical protein